MFGRRKKALFGRNVEPRCDYCQHHAAQGGRNYCLLRREPQGGGCEKFAYDPLKREPRTAPPPRDYDPEEFKL